ncbi:ribosomal biogenesis protein LAS1L [Haemaphysalis longicornis]
MDIFGKDSGKFMVVPWYNRHEWEKTYQNLFSSSAEDWAAGLGSIAVWRSRLYNQLPRPIEATAALVRACLSDNQSTNQTTLGPGVSRAEELSSLYSVAIVRFVGDIIEPVRAVKNISAKEAAFELGIPEWILDLRNASAHGAVCAGEASLSMLRSTASLLLHWLRLHHWEPQRDALLVTDAPLARKGCCTLAQVQEALDKWLAMFTKGKGKLSLRQLKVLREKKLACVEHIATFAEEDGDLVVEALVTGGDYLLPSRDALEERYPNMRLSVPSPKDGAPCELPEALAACWRPLLSRLDPSLHQRLAEGLLRQSAGHDEDASLRHCLVVAWLSHLLAAKIRPGTGPRGTSGGDRRCKAEAESAECKLNVTKLLRVAMDHPTEYTTKAITLLGEHMSPPLSEVELDHLKALAAIQSGLMVRGREGDGDGGGGRSSDSDSDNEELEEEEGQGDGEPTGIEGSGSYVPYTVEDFQESDSGFEDQEHGVWRPSPTLLDWSSTPIGALPGCQADRIDLSLDFKELRPLGQPTVAEAAGPSAEGEEAGDIGEDEELEEVASPEAQMEDISQNVQMFLM